jgi:hypothetical protein
MNHDGWVRRGYPLEGMPLEILQIKQGVDRILVLSRSLYSLGRAQHRINCYVGRMVGKNIIDAPSLLWSISMRKNFKKFAFALTAATMLAVGPAQAGQWKQGPIEDPGLYCALNLWCLVQFSNISKCLRSGCQFLVELSFNCERQPTLQPRERYARAICGR